MEFKEKLKSLEEKALLGDAKAKFELGALYFNGDGVERDIEKAILFLREAAEGGIKEAVYNLGLIYFNGNGVKKG